MNDGPRLSIRGEDKVTCGEEACFEGVIEPSAEYRDVSLIWQRIKGEIPKELDITRDKYRGSTNTKLVVRKISKKDEGGYRAVIHRDSIGNQDNLISNTIFLVAEGDPPFLGELKASADLDEIQLHYSIYSSSPPVTKITWTKNRNILNIQQIKYSGGSLRDNSLVIKLPTSDDAGQYTCTISNAVGKVSESLTLGVPSVSIREELIVPLGFEVSVEARIISCPPVISTIWEKSTTLNSTAFHPLDMSNPIYSGSVMHKNDSKLVIRNTTIEDDGLYYRLVVTNRIGQHTSNTMILKLIGGTYMDPTEISTEEQGALVTIGKDLTNGHQVCMKIKNLSDTPMLNGSVACRSGIIDSVLPKSIQTNSFYCIGFQKTSPLMPRGAVGTVAYELGNYKLCIRYSNPYVGTNKGGFLWKDKNFEITESTEDHIWRFGINFESNGRMEWKSLRKERFVVEGFITGGNPAYLHVHVRNT